MTDDDRQIIASRLLQADNGRGVVEIEVDDLAIGRIEIDGRTYTLVGVLAYEVEPADAYDDRDERLAEDRADREGQAARINDWSVR